MGNWPTYPTMQIKIPIELQQQQEVFSKFYTSKHNGRQLQWQYSLITSILKATFKPNIRKELEVSMFQALVLLCFNSKTEYSFAEIQNETQIEESELKRTLQSLACGKFRVLNKEPRGREVENDDKFIFNEQFTVFIGSKSLKLCCVKLKLNIAKPRNKSRKTVSIKLTQQLYAS
jgi:cullin-4